MKFRSVIFDLWQTLVPWQVDEANRFYDRMADAVGVERGRFREVWLAGRPSRETGPIADHLRALLGDLEVDGDIDELIALRRDWTKRSLIPRADALETLAELRRRGHRLGLISVCSQDVPEVWDETPLAGSLDETVFSCEVGISKPDPRIYEIACERLDVEPAECLFVGDGANDELPGAERAGMTAVQLRVPGETLTPDGEAWEGASIESLEEVLELA
ncbi:MAG TPA: HAD family hydrolase [Gaiellaceae bacterium]|jgi:putative hydrolase of the HAD superfamily|nr:HAD family hydrolase [Gaiellaceae bacterium]